MKNSIVSFNETIDSNYVNSDGIKKSNSFVDKYNELFENNLDIKDNKIKSRSIFSIDKYVTEIRIPENCSLIGENAGEVNNLTGDKITLIRIINDDEVVEYLDPNYILKECDQFLIMADPTELKIAMDEYNFKLTKEMRYRIDSQKEDDTTFMEVVVTPESSLLGRTRNYFRKETSNCLTLI